MTTFFSSKMYCLLSKRIEERRNGERKRKVRFLRGSNPRPSACKADVITTTPRNRTRRTCLRFMTLLASSPLATKNITGIRHCIQLKLNRRQKSVQYELEHRNGDGLMYEFYWLWNGRSVQGKNFYTCLAYPKVLFLCVQVFTRGSVLCTRWPLWKKDSSS